MSESFSDLENEIHHLGAIKSRWFFLVVSLKPGANLSNSSALFK